MIADLELLLKKPAKNRQSRQRRTLGNQKNLRRRAAHQNNRRRTQRNSEEDLIPEEEVVITLTNDGYVKRIAPSVFRSQRRGGTGLIGSEVGEEDF